MKTLVYWNVTITHRGTKHEVNSDYFSLLNQSENNSCYKIVISSMVSVDFNKFSRGPNF